MKRPFLLVLAALTLVTLLALLVTRISSPPEAVADEPFAGAAHGASSSPDSIAEPRPAAAESVDLVAPVAAQDERAVAPDPNEDLGPTLAIEGRVIPPANCAADPTVEVFAVRRMARLDDVLREIRPRGTRGQPVVNVIDGSVVEEDDMPATRKLILARAPIGADGSYRIDVPESAKNAHVIAVGRSWHVREGRPVDKDDPSRRIDFEMECGAWIDGVVRVPSSVDVAELDGLRVELEPSIEGFTGNADNSELVRRATGIREGAFEFWAIDPDSKTSISATPAKLAVAHAQPGDLRAGRATRVELEFLTGGTIRGTVRSTDGAPIPNALVSANEKGRWFGFDDKSVRNATTPADGSFELVGVAVGKLDVKVACEGWLAEKSEKLDVVDGAVIEGVALVLGRGASISGTLHWPDGRPAEGVEVEVSFDRTHMGGMGAFGMLKGAKGETKVDASGRFEVVGLGSGPFVVEAKSLTPEDEKELGPKKSSEEDLRDPTTGIRLPRKGIGDARRAREHRARADSVKPGTKDLALVLRPPTGVRGRVVDSTGAPVTAFKVEANGVGKGMLANLGQEEVRESFEAESGEFLLTGLHSGEWKLHVEAEGFSTSTLIEFAAPLAPDAPEFVVQLERAAVVRGFVYGPDGKRVAKAEVTVDDGGPNWMRAMSGMKPPEATSGEDGSFTLSPLRPGTTTIVAEHSDHARSTPLVLELTAGQVVEGAELRLTLGGRLTGEVFHEGKPAVGMMVQVQDMTRFSQKMAHTDGEGRFEVVHLDPGKYQVIAMPMTMGESLVDEEGEFDQSSMLESLKMTTAEIAEGTDTHVVLGAPPEDPVKVEGTITMAGAPVPSATLTFLPEGGKKGGGGLKFTPTKKDGSYSVTLDGPGAYSVSVQRMDATMTGQSTFEERHVIPKKAEFKLDITLPEGRISGRVIGKDGEPAAGARVSVVREGAGIAGTMWGGQFHELHTNEAGGYDATGLPAGTYSVMAGGAELGGMLGDGSTTGGREIKPGIEVGEKDWRRGVDFRLKEAAIVEITVVDGSGHAVTGASIFARDEGGRSLDTFSFVTTDAAGKAKYTGLAAGRYTFRARTDSMSSNESAPIRVTTGEKASANLVVQKGTYVIVKVVDGEKNPIVAAVEVLDENGHDVAKQMGFTEIMERIQGGAFDATERKFGPYAAGKYKVRVTSESGKVDTKTVSLSGQPERRVTLELD